MFATSSGQYVCIAMVVNIWAICGDMPRWETPDAAAAKLPPGHRVSWFAILDAGVAQRVDEVVVVRVCLHRRRKHCSRGDQAAGAQ